MFLDWTSVHQNCISPHNKNKLNNVNGLRGQRLQGQRPHTHTISMSDAR